jgi:hypothetical protein
VAGRILGGWSLAAIATIQSGTPLTFSSGQHTQLNGTGASSRADVVGDPKREHSSRDDMIAKFFNTDAFATPPPGGVGTGGRGILSGPAFSSTDLAVLKDIRVSEAFRFQLRGEFFNVLNQVNFTRVQTTMTNSLFGRIDQSGPGRSVQLGLKFLW